MAADKMKVGVPDEEAKGDNEGSQVGASGGPN